MALFGREEELRRLTGDSLAGRFIVIDNAPGLGATSLLTSGLAPKLREAGFITVYFSDWQGRDFSTHLKEAVTQAVREQADPLFFAQSELLEDMLRRVRQSTGHPVALFLDQFEDYLRFHQGTDVSDEFDAELGQAVNSRTGQIAVALHSHSVVDLDRLTHVIPNLLGGRMQLSALSRVHAGELIRDLGRAQFIPVDDAVVDSFANAAAATVGEGVHPWLLTQGVNRLLDAAGRRKPAVANAVVVEALGGPDRLILQCLDETIEKLSLSHKEVLFQWYNVLVSHDGHRRAATEKALIQSAGKLDRFALSLLPILLRDGFLRMVNIAGVSRYELARESMTVILTDWHVRQESLMAARRRARFRTRSMSIAVGSILLLYAAWLYLSLK